MLKCPLRSISPVISISKESMAVLADLQARDHDLDQLRARLGRIPEEAAGLREGLEGDKARAEEMKAQGKKLQLERKEKEVELATKEETVRKHQRELNEVKSNEAFKALQREIDLAKEGAGKIEEEVLLLMERVDESLRKEKEEAKRIEGLRQEVERKVGDLAAEGERIREDLAKKTSEREEIASRIAPETLKQYLQIRARKGGLALVPVRNGTCGGCNMKLIPQAIVEVKKGTQIVLCDGCQRILHLV